MLIPCGSIIITLSISVIIFSVGPPLPLKIKILSCKEGWVGYDKNCYHLAVENVNRCMDI
nr:C-type lectin family protein [Oriental turtle dovepox virus]